MNTMYPMVNHAHDVLRGALIVDIYCRVDFPCRNRVLVVLRFKEVAEVAKDSVELRPDSQPERNIDNG